MKKSFVKKALLMAAASVFLAGSLYAGGKQQSGTSGSSSAGGATPSLTVACLEGWYSAVSMNDNLPVWQEMEKRTGVHINWQANADYDTAMNPVIASGRNLPDIMLIPPTWTNAGVTNLAIDGTIIPLDDLIARHAPNIQKVFNANPDIKALMTCPDGKIYSIADVIKDVNNMVLPGQLYIRKDWLNKLGLQVPKTIDDWYTVLTAFKNGDPNGNGKQDEVPFAALGSGANNDEAATMIYGFGSGFGLPVSGYGYESSKNWWYDASGKVYFIPTSRQFRDALSTINKWYREGLVDQTINRVEADNQALIATNVVGAAIYVSGYKNQLNSFTQAAAPDSEWILVEPPAAKAGTKLQVLKRSPTFNFYGISKDCKDPVTAIKWIDYVWGTDAGVALNEWGIEGQTYTMVNGKKQFTDYVLKNPEGLDPYNALRKLGAANTVFNRTPEDVYIALTSGDPETQAMATTLLPYRAEPFPALMHTDDVQATINRISPDLDTYLAESRGAFFTGSRALDDSTWNNFVSTINGLGVNTLLPIMQSDYDKTK